MSICIDLPADLEAQLRRQVADLDQAAKEALLVDLYRRQQITQHELAAALAIDRFAADALLARHGVTEDLPTADEIRREVAELEVRLGK
jgi:hypothetical protein